MFINKLLKAFKYLLDGTLTIHIKSRLHEYMRQFDNSKKLKKQYEREKTWNTFKDRPELIYDLQTDVKIVLYTDDFLSKLIYCTDYETNELRFLSFVLRPGDIFLDIGANMGLYALAAAKIVKGNGHVYAFEPTQQPYNRLVRNVQLNNFHNVSCLKLALSDKEAELRMKSLVLEFSAWNSLANAPMEGEHLYETVQTCLLDNFINHENKIGYVRMMKIDVEGWENHVLAGSRNLLMQPNAPILQVEFNEDAMRSSNSSCFELYKTLEDLGYSLFNYDGKKNKLLKAPFHSDRKYFWENLIALKSSSKAVEISKLY